MEEIKNRLQKALSIRNITPIELSLKTKIPKSSISQYMSGYAKPKQDRVFLISKALSINPTWLLGYDVDMNENIKKTDSFMSYNNIFKIEKKKIPMLGSIACGEPIYVDEDKQNHIMIKAEIKADFCLKCKGDSMINARIYDGDIVFVKRQNIVNNGEIAVVIIDNEATLKRFYYHQDKNMVILKSENSKYDDKIFIGEELDQVRVIGKAIAFQSDIK